MIMDTISEARQFAEKVHQGSFRKEFVDGKMVKGMLSPISGIRRMFFRILGRLTDDEDVLCAAYLHDCLEDGQGYQYNKIKKQFGIKVADIVKEVSKDRSENFPIKTKEGLMVKLADTLDNIRDCKDKIYIQKKIKLMFKH